jgi:hypothetical protein
MFFEKHIIQNYLLISIILKVFLCQRLSGELLESWGEKTISDATPHYSQILETIEKYLGTEEGYTLDETDIIPFGLFKQTINGINYRVLTAVKKKTSKTPTIYDIMIHQHSDEFKVMSSKKPDYTSTDISEKDKKKMQSSIYKYFLEKEYTLKELEIEYEYHNLGGLYNYAVYDVIASLENDDENVDKRLLIVYRNDRTFTVEEEMKEKEES